jgi:hypothetical protein
VLAADDRDVGRHARSRRYRLGVGLEGRRRDAGRPQVPRTRPRCRQGRWVRYYRGRRRPPDVSRSLVVSPW